MAAAISESCASSQRVTGVNQSMKPFITLLVMKGKGWSKWRLWGLEVWHEHKNQGRSLGKKAASTRVTTMLATSKNVLFPGHNHLLTTGVDEQTL